MVHYLEKKDILKFMDDGKEGVIYFSLGSIVPIHIMPKEIIQIFINVFKKLPQKVIWKISQLDPDLFELPKNVMIKKWAPQIGILAHPNCKLFLTHGGLMSTHEALNAGVPTVGIPFFADQPFNVRFLEHRGVGVQVDFPSISEDSLHSAVTTVLNNQKYKENAAKLSRIYEDRPQSAAETAVFWVEYVLRHKGAQHLRPASATMSLYQLFLLDIIAAIIVAFICLGFIVYLFLKKLLGIIFDYKKTQ